MLVTLNVGNYDFEEGRKDYDEGMLVQAKCRRCGWKTPWYLKADEPILRSLQLNSHMRNGDHLCHYHDLIARCFVVGYFMTMRWILPEDGSWIAQVERGGHW